MMVMQSAAGANLSFLRDRILYARDALLQDEARPDVYRILDEIAAGCRPARAACSTCPG